MRQVSPPGFLAERTRAALARRAATRGASAMGERFRWRLARLWRSRTVRRAALVQVPAAALMLGGVWLARDPEVHLWVSGKIDAATEALAAQPRFAIKEIHVEGASKPLEAEIHAALTDALGRSSLSVRAETLRARIESLTRVRSAGVALQAPAQLLVRVEERIPAALLRDHEGRLRLIDVEGAPLAPIDHRADRPDLPLLTGAGAARAVPEALGVIAAAGPLAPRLRGLIRIGERRWDAALSHDQRILLPALGAIPAMRRAAGWSLTHELFRRDLAQVDLRLPDRPFVRLRDRAIPAFVAKRPELRSPSL